LIISHKYKFIFIKTLKTAGTSIEVFLSQCCGEDDIFTPIWPHIEPHRSRNFRDIWNPIPEIIENRGIGLKSTLRSLLHRNKYYNHIPALTVRARVSRKVWNSYFKFSVERNPWDKTLSHYHMDNERAGGGISLEEYIERGSFCINYPLYTDHKGTIILDKVIKYESLAEQLSQVFDKLGIPFDGSLGIRAKSDHRKDRRPYQKVFTREQSVIIKKAFIKEIDIHRYEFRRSEPIRLHK